MKWNDINEMKINNVMNNEMKSERRRMKEIMKCNESIIIIMNNDQWSK